MILVQNFTEFYNILKTHPNITNVVPEFKNYISLVEQFKSTCNCRGSEKQRLKFDCETKYRLLVTNEVSNNIELFKNTLGDKSLRFTHNQGIIKEF